MIHVVGLGMGGANLGIEALRAVEGAQVLAGGRAHLEAFAHLGKEAIEIGSPVSKALDAMAHALDAGKSLAVLAGGDPLYFGIGALVARRFGRDMVRVHANVCAMQAAAARLGLPWHEAVSVSLHGRNDPAPLFAALTHHRLVGVYTDPANTPAVVASLLLERGTAGVEMHVFSRLGMEDEAHAAPPLKAARDMSFAEPHFLVLRRAASPGPRLGRPDGFFAHAKGLITKAPVRAAALAALDLAPDSTLWDLGAGCGAVGIEAAALLPRGRVLAVERDQERLGFIRENLARAGAWLVEPVAGAMPGVLDSLPDPDRVFLGGGAREPRILEACARRLRPGGVLVAHAILLDTLHTAVKTFTGKGWSCSVTQIGAAVSEPLAGDLRLAAQNPIFMVRTAKPEGRA